MRYRSIKDLNLLSVNDGLTDGPTDKSNYRDAWMHLKKM